MDSEPDRRGSGGVVETEERDVDVLGRTELDAGRRDRPVRAGRQDELGQDGRAGRPRVRASEADRRADDRAVGAGQGRRLDVRDRSPENGRGLARRERRGRLADAAPREDDREDGDAEAEVGDEAAEAAPAGDADAAGVPVGGGRGKAGESPDRRCGMIG